MKRLITILNIFLWACQIYAQPNLHSCIPPKNNTEDKPERVDSMLIVVGPFTTPVIFDVNKYSLRPTPQLKKAAELIRDRKETLIHVWIHGSASPEGPVAWNQKLGKYRAKALADYLSQETGLTPCSFRIYNLGEDWRTLEETLKDHEDFPNREHIQEILSEEQDDEMRKQKIVKLDGGKTWRRMVNELFPLLRNARMAIVYAYPKPAPNAPEMTPKARTDVSLTARDLLRPNPFPATSGKAERSNWKITVKNNLLFDAVLVANLGVEISPWTHWSLDIPVWYSPYDISPTRHIRLLAVQPEIRWWPKEAMAGHFVGLHTHVAGFNIALNDYARYQDPNHALWGLGLSYGYAMQLGKSGHWGLEFTLGAGFAQYQYDAYRNENNGQKFKSGSDCYWGITRAGVTLSYKWTFSRKNRKN